MGDVPRFGGGGPTRSVSLSHNPSAARGAQRWGACPRGGGGDREGARGPCPFCVGPSMVCPCFSSRPTALVA